MISPSLLSSLPQPPPRLPRSMLRPRRLRLDCCYPWWGHEPQSIEARKIGLNPGSTLQIIISTLLMMDGENVLWLMNKHPLISGANAGFVTPIKWTNFNNCSLQNPVPRSKLLISPELWLQSLRTKHSAQSLEGGGWFLSSNRAKAAATNLMEMKHFLPPASFMLIAFLQRSLDLLREFQTVSSLQFDWLWVLLCHSQPSPATLMAAIKVARLQSLFVQLSSLLWYKCI